LGGSDLTEFGRIPSEPGLPVLRDRYVSA
jgi:hypothetical protein